MGFYGTNGSYQFTAISAVPLNQWTHVAIVVASTVPRFYYNGVLNNTGTASQLSSLGNGTTITIGDDNTGNANSSFTGYISNLRVVKGLAVYTGNFTPSTIPLTATQSAGTNIAAITGTTTGLLTCQSNRFRDSSTNNFVITAAGTPKVQAFQPFLPTTTPLYTAPAAYGGSGYFNGTTDYLYGPYNSAFNFTTGLPLCVEGWVYPTSTSGTRPIVEIRTSGSNSTGFALVSQSGATTVNVYTNAVFVGASTNSLTTNQWNHVALVRSGNTWTYWINGVSGGSFTNSSTQSDGATTGPKIGGSTTAGELWAGYLSNIRILKGTALYLTTFTPSTIPLTAITNTSLLLNTVSGAYLADSSTNSFVVTATGSPVWNQLSPFATGLGYKNRVYTYTGSGTITF
jgi:hypothetical protein